MGQTCTPKCTAFSHLACSRSCLLQPMPPPVVCTRWLLRLGSYTLEVSGTSGSDAGRSSISLPTWNGGRGQNGCCTSPFSRARICRGVHISNGTDGRGSEGTYYRGGGKFSPWDILKRVYFACSPEFAVGNFAPTCWEPTFGWWWLLLFADALLLSLRGLLFLPDELLVSRSFLVAAAK